MKLHLPTALRRALLALIALLSPAVVTTTFATATLAAITAPAIAEDLDLTLDSTYEFSGSVSFDSVTTGSPNDVIKATAGGSTFTAGIVTIGTGHALDITNSGYHDWNFMVESLDTSQGGSIKINAFASMYATGTFYDLYNKIEANSIEVWGAGAWYIYGKGHSDSETTNLVKTSDLFEKLSTGYRTFFNITEGNVIIDKNISDNSNSWLNIGVENGTKDTYATVSTNVTQLSIATQIFSGSKMEIEESSEALTVDRSIYVYGELVSNRDLILEEYASFESGASVTLNGHTTIDEECTARGILTTVGGITINDEAILEIANGATLNIGAPIVINGGEVATGQFCTINIISSCFDTENITYHYSEGDNGYLRKIDYTVLTGTGSVSIPDSIDWRVDGFLSNSNYSNGVLTVMSYDSSVYHVASGTIDYGTDVTDLATDTTKFCMKGGSLVLSKNLKDTQGIKVDVASSVSINNDVTLKASQLDASAADVTLSGGGSYTMTNGANTLGSGVSVGSGWSGTVNTTGDTTALELNTLGVSGSNVVLGSNSHTLAARDQSVAANITSTGSISLTGYTLTLSGTNSLGSVSVGSLEITGGSTAISNGLTTDSISGTVSVTGGTLQEMTAGSAISTSGTVALSNVTLGAVLNNSGTLNLGGTINVDSTALTSGTRERYSNEDNGYKTVDTTYTVLTGNAATGTATWKVGTDSATYEDGMVIVAGIEDKSVYYVRNGDVNYTQSLAQATTIFSLEGGHLQLGETLLDTQSIVSKNHNSWVCLKDEAVQLKSSQISLDGAEFVTLQAADGGTYIIDKVVDGIVELTLGTGVKLAEGLWWGTVKTVGDTTVSSDLDTTGWKNTELNGTTTVNSGVTLTLGGNTTLGGKIENSGTLNLGGTINVDSTALTSGTRERYSAGNNGYKITDTTYTVLTGGAVTGTATWKVGTQSATYEDGMVIVAGIEDTAVYYVRNGDVAYTRTLANDTTTFSLDGGHLVLNESLKDTQSIEWKSTASWLNINNDAVDLKSSQLSTVGAGNFTLIAPDGGTYIIDKKVGDIVELTLGTGVTLSDEHWWGWVKTVGDTTVSSDLDTTGWKNTELNGTTTVNSGATLTLGGNTKLKGQIANNGTLVLGGNIDVLSSMTHTSKSTFATTGDASDLGTESGSGFASSLDVYSVVEGNSATGSATWTVDGQAAHYDSGKVSLLTGKDTSTWWMNAAAAYSSISGNFVTGSTTTLALNMEGGTLQLDTDPGVTLISKKAATIEIDNGVTLNAAQLDASAADVTLRGNGSYTLEDGAHTLGEGVNVGTGWTGTVNTTGDTSALELDTLGVSGSKVELGNATHTLAARDQEVAAGLNSTGSMSLSGNKLTLSGENTLGSLNAGSLAITGGSTTITNGLTTGGESSVATGATLSLSGNSTLGGKISNSGTLVLGGNIDVLGSMTHTSKATFATTGAASDLGTESGSGFASSLDVYSVVDGNAATGTATWTVGGQAAHYDSGKVSLLTNKDTTTWWMNSSAAYSTISGNFVTGSTTSLALNTENGTLQLDTDPGVKLVSRKAATIEIGNNVNLNANQLDARAAVVTLTGSGSYTMTNGANTLGSGVSVGSDWSGTVKLTGAADALELSSLGNALSSIDLDSFDHTLADGVHVIDSALMGSGSLKLNEGSKLTLNGDCSNWSGDIIGQVELELTEGGTIGGNVQVDSLHIGESSATFEGNLTTTGTITVSENATLSLNGNTTLGGTIESADFGKVELAGQITVDVENFKSSTEVKDVTGYFIGSSRTPNSTNSGFEAACWDITIAEGGTITDKGATWKLVGDEKATFDFAADGTLHAYGSGVGTVFHVAEGDTISYSESNAEDFVNSKGEAASAIQLNGGTLVLQSELDTKVKSAAASSVVIADGVTLNASQLDTSAADVTLRGEGSYTMQEGQELSGEVKLDNGVALDANEWKGTVYTGSTEQGAALDITALGNSQSTVYLGAQPMRRSMPGETVLESLIAAGVGTTETPGSLTLQKGTSTADALVVNGILTLGSADAAAGLVADSVSLQGLSFAHADSSLVAGSLEGATTLNVQLTDEVLSNKDAGETLTLVTLEEGFEGTLTFNDSTETERVRSEDNRKEYTLAWNEAGTTLTLTILGTETYVTEQVKPTTHSGKAGVALMTDVFLNSRPQKDAPDGALAGILNAVDASTATDRDMAAVAGASTAALGMALSGDVERQLGAIRNRSMSGNTANTITLASEKSGKQTGSRFFAWVNAEGNRAEQDADSTAAGYTLTSWGGTLGAGMQVNDKLTLGLALTAMHGDLKSDGPDYLKGDMDTAYLSAFARYNRGKWSHAFIGTAGTMEADYKRSAMSYSTDGDTDGIAFGLMYEVSRGVQLSNRSTLSPVFNISYRHTAVDSYSESGADAALNVGKQSLDTVTAGAGARYAAVVGQRMLNRACGFEARALVKYDLGDRQSTTSTGFTGYATRAGIESAELGAFGVELGAGISEPVGTGSIFADGAVELRSDYTNFNAAVGYRVQF